MSSNFIDLTGQKFGRLTVIKRAEDHIQPSGKHRVCWLCKCDCGNKVIIKAFSLRCGYTKSCGCLQKEKASNINKKHDLSHTKIYTVWNNMKARCYNQNKKAYKNYGARGIKVCDEWLHSFESFYNWAMSNGYDENAMRGECTIDRIDVNKGYFPENCRWITIKEQQRNRTNNKVITINSETKSLPEWCEILNLNYNTVRNRINNYHWSPERALEIGSNK